MILPSLKFAPVLEFIRHERIYFLIFLLALALIAFSPEPSSLPEILPSAEVNQLEQASRHFGESLDGLSAWLRLFQARPAAVLTCITLLSLFAGLFFGGLVILIFIALIPGVSRWFQDTVPRFSEPAWKPVHFFRVLILIFSFTTASVILMEGLWIENSRDENLVGLFHTLLIDLFACLVVFAVLKGEGMSWSRLIGKPAVSYGQEIKRGLAAYAAVFPVFISILFLVLGISEWLNYEPPLHPLVKIFVEEEGRSAFVFQFALILATIAAPIFEEIFFRGFCYRLFRSWWGAPAAMGVSAAFFAGIHGSGFAFFPIFILGLALARLYEQRASLTACWTFHVMHNILFTGYFFAIKALIGS